MSKTLVTLLIVLVLGATASNQLGVFGAEKSDVVPASSLFTVKRGDLDITITENGYLKAKNSLNIKPKFKGTGTITWLIDEGEEVEEGQKLVEFDKTELESRITEAENSLIQYEIELEAAKAGLQIQERDNQAGIEKAELDLEIATLTLERYEKGEAPNQLRIKTLAEEKANSELERAKERYEQVPELREQGFLTSIQEEEERIRLREAEINQENAARDLSLYQEYTTRMELTQKQAALKDGTRILENAREKAHINSKEKQAVVAQKERQVTTTRTRLEQLKEELGHHTITAEKAGIVHYGDPSRPWMRDQVKIGNEFRPGNTIITLPDLKEMQVLIQVHEADIDQIEKGMSVIVTVDTQKGQAYPATITDIASVASSNNWMDETNKSFRVEVTLASQEGKLRAGITARAEIQVDTMSDVLYAPIHAVFPEGGKHLAFVETERGYEARELEVGRNNAHYVEIRSGLEAGEKVRLHDPRDAGAGGADQGGADEEAGMDASLSEMGTP